MRLYEVSNVPAGTITATKTVLLLTAGAGKPLKVRESRITISDNATSFQLSARWQKVDVIGIPAGAGTTTTVQVDEGGAAASLTALGDLSAEPTSYLASVFRGPDDRPSVSGWRHEPRLSDEFIRIEAGDSWGLVITTATFAASKCNAFAVVEEEG